MEKTSKRFRRIMAASLSLLMLASCGGNQAADSWWNRFYFDEGTYYFESMEGYCTNDKIKFDESTYFVLSYLEDGDAYDDMIRAETPTGLWGSANGVRGEEYTDLKFEWFNCYFAEMPSLRFFAQLPEGKVYGSTGEMSTEEGYVHNQWYLDYPEAFSGQSPWPITASIELHEENQALSAVRITFYIPDVCELVIYFTFVPAS